MPQRQLGDLMTELGLITQEQLATVLEVQQRSERPLGQIIVELGFASGAAVAHALAMQSGGALKTEHGFALGVGTRERDLDEEETRAGLPKLRLAPTAVQPSAQVDLEPTAAPAAEDDAAVEPMVPAEADEVVPEAAESVAADAGHDLDEALVDRLEAALADAETRHEEELRLLREQHEQATAELERLQAWLADAQTASKEQERRLAEEHERHGAAQSELAGQIDRLQEELARALEGVAAAELGADERDQLRSEVERLEATMAEAQAAATAEHERVRAELERLEAELAEAQTAAAEQERRLAEERELHAADRTELAAHGDRLQEELASALERERAVPVGATAEERDQLRAEVERLESALVEVQESCAVELRRAGEERDHLTSELVHAQEMLQQAERVRESQIALVAERDHALAELERLEAAAAEAQATAEEQTRQLADEQDRHESEREALVAQRALLEQELAGVLEQLSATAPAADDREQELQLGAERLRATLEEAHAAASASLERLEAIRRSLDSTVGATSDDLHDEPEPTADAPEPAPATVAEPIDYSLFVPGPSGYELVPRTGVVPQAGETVELVLAGRDDLTQFEVVRRSRLLPKGNVFVYLTQV